MRSRATLIVVLLGASFLTTLVIAARALMGTTYHRATAEGAMRDFAALAADEFVRDADAQISFYGCYPIAQKIASGEPVPASPLVRTAFPIDTLGAPNDAVPAPLRALLAEALKKKTPIVRAGGSTFYLGVAGRGPLPRVIGGLELEPKAFRPFLQDVVRMRKLLPQAITRGRVTNDAIYIRVSEGATPIFTTRGRFEPALGIRHDIDAADGALAGMKLEASIDGSAAPLLVFGGLPPSRMPLYVTMLVINLVLLVTAALQLHRERVLARLRSDFISGVSHELRTPLTQIRMFAETLLLDRARNDEERRRSLTIIDQETRRLAHLVENILQFSRGERGTSRIAPAPHDAAALVRATVDAFAPIAKARGVTIDVDASPTVLNIDEDAIRQVMLNLLDNAVKYGPDNQRIVTGVRGRELFVDDGGPGIPESDRNRIFERYRRLDRERSRAIAGMGIGLSVVRELVTLHGGRVRVEANERGGARFVVTL